MEDKTKLGMILFVFITVIVGVVFFQAIAQSVGTSTNTVEVANESIATVVNGTPQYLTNYQALSSVVILNETNGTAGSSGIAAIGAGNYTITNNVLNNGALAVKITPTATAAYKSAWKVSGTAQPLTYIKESGGRAVAGLIVIFFALLVAVIAMYPVLQQKDIF